MTSAKLLVSILGAALAGTALAAAYDKPAPDEAAVRGVLDAQVVAWNKGDLKTFMAGYWNSPNLSFYSGTKKATGWNETYERYRKKYQADGKEMGKLSFSELDIELHGPDTAVVRGRWLVEMKKEKHNGLFTLIVKKFRDGWKIVHDHTSGE